MPEEPVPGRVLTEVSYGDPSSVEPGEVATLLDRPDAESRRAGAEALARLASTSPERVEPLASDLDAYLETDDPEVRAHVLCTLASVARETPSAVSVTTRVLEGLVDDDPKVREWAALVVAYVGGTPAAERQVCIDRLLDRLEDDRATVRRNACLALAQLGEGVDAVRSLRDDPDEAVRETATKVTDALE